MRPASRFLFLVVAILNCLSPSNGQDQQAKQPTKQTQSDPLPKGALERFGSTALRHDGVVSSLAWSHDGTWLASGGHDKTICIWDAKTGQRLKCFTGHTDAVFAIAVSPDSKKIASASRDKTVRVWDVATGKELWKSDAHGDAVCCVAFSPDGKMLASGGDDGIVRLWDAGSGKRERQLAESVNIEQRENAAISIHAVAFSPNGTTLASGGMSKVIRLWNLNSNSNAPRWSSKADAEVHGLAFSPDGKTLASASPTDDSATQLWEVATGSLRLQCSGKGRQATGVAYSQDGKSLVLCPIAENYKICFFDPVSGNCQSEMKAGGGSIFAVALAPDGKTVACAGNWPRIQLRDIATGQDRIANAAQWAGMEQITHSFEPMLPAGIPRPRAMSSAFSFDQRIFAYIVDKGSTVHIWDVFKGKKIKELSLALAEDEGVWGLAISSDASTIAAEIRVFHGRFADVKVYLWNCATGKKIGRCDFETGTTNLMFSPDGRSLAGSHSDVTRAGLNAAVMWLKRDGMKVRVCETATGGRRLELDESHTFAFSPDSRLLATGTGLSWFSPAMPKRVKRYDGDSWQPGNIQVWDLTTGKKLASWDAHVDSVMRLAFFDRGKKLASVGWDGLGYAWAVPSRPRSPANSIAANQFDELWAALGGDRIPADAFSAQCKLIGTSNAVSFLKKKRFDVDAPVTERLRQDRALEILERINTAEARDLLQALAKGAPGMWLTRQAQASLERLNSLQD